jgi:hypothetical protein
MGNMWSTKEVPRFKKKSEITLLKTILGYVEVQHERAFAISQHKTFEEAENSPASRPVHGCGNQWLEGRTVGRWS